MPRITPRQVIGGALVIVGELSGVRALVAEAGSTAFASPKSSTLTVPSGRTLMLAGFRSR